MSILGPQVFKLCNIEPNKAYALRPGDHHAIEQAIIWWPDNEYEYSSGVLRVTPLGETLSGTRIGTVDCNKLITPNTNFITVSKARESRFWTFDSEIYHLKDDWKEHISKQCLMNILKYEAKINDMFSLARQIKGAAIK